MALDANRQSVILAAINVTGPIGDDVLTWEAKLKQNARRVNALLNEHSPIAKDLDMLEDEKDTKRYITTIVKVGKEAKTNRAFIVFKSKPTDRSPDGFESARTEIVNWGEKSGEAYDFAVYLRSLVGHRVTVYIQMQETKDKRKVRVLQYVQDLGVDSFLKEDDVAGAEGFYAEKIAA